MTTLTVTTRGQVTFRKKVLQHLGIKPGEKIALDLLPDGRGVIRAAGFGEYFTHRTGHNIGQELHGAGAHLDNLETHDERRILPCTCFSVEPGIYLPEFGVRSEVDMMTAPGKAWVTGRIQQELVRI